MTRLTLRVDKHLDTDEATGSPPTVLATLYRIDAETGRRDRGVAARREMIPISNVPQHARAIDLQPGRWVVEVTLPCGGLLAEQVELREGGQADVALEAERSPHEWLGWQHLVGNVASALPAFAKVVKDIASKVAASLPADPAPTAPKASGKAGSAPQKSMVRRPRSRSTSSSMSKDIDEGAERRAPAKRADEPPDTAETKPAGGAAEVAPPPAARSALPSAIEWLPTPVPALVPDQPGDPWVELAKLADEPAAGIPGQLNGGHPLVRVQAFARDDRRAVYRIVRSGAAVSSAVSLGSTLQRDFVAVPFGDRVELIALPTPWIVSSGHQAMVEIVVQQVVERRAFATSLTVRDDRLSVLLGYLSSGAMTAARDLAGVAHDMLYSKTQNPLGAAAGGYALVGTMTDSSQQPWHAWVANLAEGFDQVPDGAIQLAMLHLKLRREAKDLTRARDLVVQAYRRGLPFYSLGTRWLLEVLEKLAGDDAEMRAMHAAVQRLAPRTHPQSPFTILRLGKV